MPRVDGRRASQWHHRWPSPALGPPSCGLFIGRAHAQPMAEITGWLRRVLPVLWSFVKKLVSPFQRRLWQSAIPKFLIADKLLSRLDVMSYLVRDGNLPRRGARDVQPQQWEFRVCSTTWSDGGVSS